MLAQHFSVKVLSEVIMCTWKFGSLLVVEFLKCSKKSTNDMDNLSSCSCNTFSRVDLTCHQTSTRMILMYPSRHTLDKFTQDNFFHNENGYWWPAWHIICYKEAETLAHSLDIEVTKSRTGGKQTQRVNVPSQTVSSYYKRAVTVLDGELCSCMAKLPDSISFTLKSIPFPSYGNIKVALRILGTLPMTSCECERYFSSLRRLNDYTRNTMTADRLNGLALMYVHREIIPDIEKVIDRFSQSNRRLEI